MQNIKDIRIRDPFILPIKNEGKYYMYGTTGACWAREGKATGFACYVSSDLENFEGPYAAFQAPSDFWSEKEFWAPEVHEYKDEYYMFATFMLKKDAGNTRGCAILKSDTPVGPFTLWSDGIVTPSDWMALDGTLYVDESGDPWMIFCHEWLQTTDGEMCAIKLSRDLKQTESNAQLLFKASEAKWSTGSKSLTKTTYVTDGPYLFRGGTGELLMLWSSFYKGQYAIGVAKSTTGDVLGPWIQQDEPFFKKDGGHGMLFETFDGRLMLSIHSPNTNKKERAKFIEVFIKDDRLYSK